jgi:hypothetical protein
MDLTQLAKALMQGYQQNIGQPFANVAGPFGRGLLGLNKPEYGEEQAYRAGQALSNMPGTGAPVGLLKAAAQAPELVGLLGAVLPGVKGVSAAIKDYGMAHRPMTEAGGAARLFDLTPAFGEDIYTRNALQFFGSGLADEKTAVDIMRKVRGKPDAEITIYRGVPEGAGNAINPGDWVTLSKKTAQEYGPNVIEMKVKAKDITSWPDSLVEFGYYPQ